MATQRHSRHTITRETFDAEEAHALLTAFAAAGGLPVVAIFGTWERIEIPEPTEARKVPRTTGEISTFDKGRICQLARHEAKPGGFETFHAVTYPAARRWFPGADARIVISVRFAAHTRTVADDAREHGKRIEASTGIGWTTIGNDLIP